MKTITLTAPEGYEFTGGFRKPSEGEHYLLASGGAPVACTSGGDMCRPRYILRKLPPPALHLSDLKPGDSFRMKPGHDELVFLKPHSDDQGKRGYKYVYYGVNDHTLYHTDNDLEVVRA